MWILWNITSYVSIYRILQTMWKLYEILQATVCLKGPVKKFLPIARARNQPIT